ncbi:MAG: sulfurtransferase TusA family protein [Alphaproteobacteria bacterium]|nr:MAG: sulfurtransferase TusA family protein [Alphaproteobacteria bacterium]
MSEAEELDVRGYSCPMPVLRAQKRLREMPSGAELVVLADDPIARIDFPHFCNQTGTELLHVTEEAGHFRFHLKKP